MKRTHTVKEGLEPNSGKIRLIQWNLSHDGSSQRDEGESGLEEWSGREGRGSEHRGGRKGRREGGTCGGMPSDISTERVSYDELREGTPPLFFLEGWN